MQNRGIFMLFPIFFPCVSRFKGPLGLLRRRPERRRLDSIHLAVGRWDAIHRRALGRPTGPPNAAEKGPLRPKTCRNGAFHAAFRSLRLQKLPFKGLDMTLRPVRTTADAPLPPKDAIRLLKEGNQRFVTGKILGSRSLLDRSHIPLHRLNVDVDVWSTWIQ